MEPFSPGPLDENLNQLKRRIEAMLAAPPPPQEKRETLREGLARLEGLIKELVELTRQENTRRVELVEAEATRSIFEKIGGEIATEILADEEFRQRLHELAKAHSHALPPEVTHSKKGRPRAARRRPKSKG